MAWGFALSAQHDRILEFDDRLAQSTLSGRAIHLQILTTFDHSSFYHGDSSGYGPLLMGSIRQRTWFAVWRIIIPLLGFGGVGIVATTSGLFGTLRHSSHGLIY
jgi:hypothetical protein